MRLDKSHSPTRTESNKVGIRFDWSARKKLSYMFSSRQGLDSCCGRNRSLISFEDIADENNGVITP